MPRKDWIGYSIYALGIVLNAFRTTRWLAPLVLVYGCKLIIYGRRTRAETAEALLQRDRRPPVVYLRSFADDESEAEESDYKRGLILRTTEEQLALALDRIGPFVAVGCPGEELPEMGAARLYVSAEEWQGRVLDLIRQARLVVLHLGSTQGFWWEVEQAIAGKEAGRLLFFVPAGGGPAYEKLAHLMSARFEIEIPSMRRDSEFALVGETHPNASFLYFDRSGAPSFSPVWPGRFQRGIYSDRAIVKALFPVFDSLEVKRPRVPWHPWLKWAVLFVLPSLVLQWTFSSAPKLRRAQEKLAVAQTKLEVYGLARSVDRIRAKTGQFPSQKAWVELVLKERPITERLRQEYKERGVLVDPWGFPYRYRSPGVRNPDGFDLFSLGADGKEGGDGLNADIGNWEASR